MRDIKVVTGLISRTSEMEGDVKFIKEAFKQTNLFVKAEGIQFETLDWKEDITGRATNDVQKSINDEILDNYDFTIAVIGSRLGTITPRAESGTVEEILNTLQNSSSALGEFRLLILFSEKPIELNDIDPDELKRVRAFKEEISKKAWYKSYSSDTDLSDLVKAHLRRVRQYINEGRSEVTTDASQLKNILINPVDLTPSVEDARGIIELNEDIEILGAKIALITARLTAAMTDQTETLETVSSKLRPTNSNSENGSIINEAADAMNKLAEKLSDLNPEMMILMSDFADDVGKLIEISYEDGMATTDEDNTSVLIELQDLKETLRGTRDSVEGMRAATLGLPRLTKPINQAKVKLSNELLQTVNILGQVDKLLEKPLGLLKTNSSS